MSAREELLREMTHNHLYMTDERAAELVDAFESAERQRDAGIICREIFRIDELHHASQDQRGEAAFWGRLQWDGEVIGLRKALCVLFGWPLEESAREGAADEFVQTWAASNEGGLVS